MRSTVAICAGKRDRGRRRALEAGVTTSRRLSFLISRTLYAIDLIGSQPTPRMVFA